MKDTEQELGEIDPDQSISYPPNERRVLTQGYDLSVNTLIEQWRDGLLYIPDFQRDYVWDNGRASRLIASLLLNIPVPALYFSETEDAKYEIIDGHQRVRSIVRFTRGEFALTSLRVLGEHANRRFFRLPERDQRFLLTRIMRTIVIAQESHPTMKFSIFERLNNGAMVLNAQEIRNAIYHGALNNLLAELEGSRDFRACIGTKIRRPRMVDRELVLRFLALRSALSSYRPPLLRFLNDYMKSNRNPAEQYIDNERKCFLRTMGHVYKVFGDHAFRLTDRSGGLIERPVNRAIFDAQALAFSCIATDDIDVHVADIRAPLGALHADARFLDSVRRATGDRARLVARVSLYFDALESAGVELRRMVTE